MKYIIAIDMDGTLLNESKQISEENKKAIKNAEKEGHTVIIATGRNYVSAKDMLDNDGLHLPIIASNGAACIIDGKVLWKKVIPVQYVKEILDNTINFRVNNMVSTIGKLYLSQLRMYTEDLAEKIYYERQLLLYNRVHKNPEIFEVYNHYNDFLLNDYEVLKVLISSCYQEDINILERKFSEYKELNVTKSSKDNCEIMVKGASKGEAILQYRQMIHSETVPIVTIGDHFNDQSMFDIAEISIAMGNAPKEIQTICNKVTKTNKENGVAYAIEHLLV